LASLVVSQTEENCAVNNIIALIFDGQLLCYVIHPFIILTPSVTVVVVFLEAVNWL
jgi:hypothetical protein